MNYVIPSSRIALPFMLLLIALLTGCGAGSIHSSFPDEHTTLYLDPDTTVDFSVKGSTGSDFHYRWDIIRYDSANQEISRNHLTGAAELARSHTFTASDLDNFRTEVHVTLYRRVASGGWPVDFAMDSVTWEISKPVEKLGTQIPSSLFLRNHNDLPNLAGISDVTGHVMLDHTRFREVAALNSLTHIGGDLVVNRSPIRTASELHLNPALVLEGGLQLSNNPSLNSLTGLEFITQLDELILDNNDALKNLTGLDGLERIDGDLLIKNSAKLVNLMGAGRLAMVGGNFTLDHNFSLDSTKGLEALQEVQRNLSLLSNPLLASLEGFSGLTRVGGIFSIDLGTSQGSALDGIPSRLRNLSGLDALTHAGSIKINANPWLVSLQGLNQLTTVNRYIHLADNEQLANLHALENLTTADTISLSGNRRLRNLQGLEQLRDLNYLTILSGFSTDTSPPAEGLNSLTGIEAIGSIQHVTLIANPLSDVSALDNVSITGSLDLRANLITTLPVIQVDALKKLWISGEQITSLEGLNNISRLDSLSLYSNHQLTDLSALSGLTRVAGGIAIAHNQNLCQNAAEALVAQVQNAGGVGGNVTVHSNNACN